MFMYPTVRTSDFPKKDSNRIGSGIGFGNRFHFYKILKYFFCSFVSNNKQLS